MFTSSSRRHPRSRGMVSVVATLTVLGTLTIPLAFSPTPAFADTSVPLGSGVECANDNWQAETAADNAGHVYVIYTNYCSNHDFLFLQVSNDGGQTFGATQTLCARLGGACTAGASTHTIGGTAYKTEDDPGLYVDTTVSPPKLYVVWDATTNFTSYHPDKVLGAVSSDFGATFTMLNGGANIGGTACGGGGAAPDCTFPNVAARGSNVTVATGSTATGGSKSDQVRVISYSSNGGTSFGTPVSSGTGATNGNYFTSRRMVIDTSGNVWTMWYDVNGSAGTGNFAKYELSKTTSGSSTTSWLGTIYSAPEGPTFPGAGMAGSGAYPPGFWGGDGDLAIDGSNNLYMVIQDGRGHTTDGAPSVLRMGTCASGSGACSATGASAGQWTAPGAAQASLPRVDDKDASGCGGTEVGSSALCSVTFPRLTATSSGTLSLTWVDDRAATTVGCSPNPRWSHTCGLNTWIRTSTTGISGFTTPSVKMSDHAPFSPVWDSNGAGFKFFYGGSSGVAVNPACTNNVFAAWSESVDYGGGSINGGRLYVKNNQGGPASPTSLTAVPNGSQIDLSWPNSAGSGVTNYKVYRGSGATGDNLTLLATLGNVTSYSNTGLTVGQTFTYAVSAVGGSEGCQTVRATATAGAVVRTLTLATTPGAVGCANITTTPAPTSGDGTCTRTYADGASVSISATTPVAIDAASRYRFDSWSGDASGTGGASVTMSADRSVTANYVKQWAVTIQGTGLTCDAPINFFCDTGADTAVTVQGTGYTGQDISYAGDGFPTKGFVDDGGTLTYAYASTLSVPGSTDSPQTYPPDANKAYRLDAVSGPASGSTVTGAVTINGTFVTQRKLTFSQTGIGGDSTGTVAQVTGTGTDPTNASLTAADLGTAAFYDDGSSWTYQSPVSAGATKRYVVGSTSGTIGQADEGTTISPSYGTEYVLTLDTNPAGVGTGHITPSPTSGDGFYASGTAVSLTADGSVFVSGAPYAFLNWTGDLTTSPDTSNPVNVTMDQARSVTANYALDTTAQQPDGRIGTSSKVGKMVGNDIYNTTARHQTKSAKAKRGTKKTFYVSIQNDGGATDTFVIGGGAAAKGFSVKYFVGTKDVTTSVKSGAYEIKNLAAGAAKTLKVVIAVKSTAKLGAIQKAKVTATSKGTAIADAVKAKLKAT